MHDLTIKADISDLLWLRERLHTMRHNSKHADTIARLSRLIDGLTIGTELSRARLSQLIDGLIGTELSRE